MANSCRGAVTGKTASFVVSPYAASSAAGFFTTVVPCSERLITHRTRTADGAHATRRPSDPVLYATRNATRYPAEHLPAVYYVDSCTRPACLALCVDRRCCWEKQTRSPHHATHARTGSTARAQQRSLNPARARQARGRSR